MHTWPTLLASITWLIELLTYDEEVQNKQLVRSHRGQTSSEEVVCLILATCLTRDV